MDTKKGESQNQKTEVLQTINFPLPHKLGVTCFFWKPSPSQSIWPHL